MEAENEIRSEMTNEHIEELASVYALGAIGDHESDLLEFERLVESGNPILSKSLEEMLEASTLLAVAAPQILPPPDLRANILKTIQKEPNNRADSKEAYDSEAVKISARRLKKRTRGLIYTLLISGLLVSYLLSLNVTNSAKLDRSNGLMKALLRQTDSLRSVLDPDVKSSIDSIQPVVESLAKVSDKQFYTLFDDPDLRLVTLASMPSGANREYLFFSRKHNLIYFVVNSAHPMNASKAYTLWANIGSRSPLVIGSFRIDSKKNEPIYGFPSRLKNMPVGFFITEENNADHVIFTGDVQRQ
ncbi:MAG: hypothetical protein WCH46_07425 [bacterium]